MVDGSSFRGGGGGGGDDGDALVEGEDDDFVRFQNGMVVVASCE